MTGQSNGWMTIARVLRRIGFGTTGPQLDAVARQIGRNTSMPP
jgi:hypothetical protein